MPGSILICATAIMAAGIRSALCAVMPDLDYRLYCGEIAAQREVFARLASDLHPRMTILDADSVNIQEVLLAFGKSVVGQGVLGKIVVLTTKPDEEELFRLAKYGARAYFSGCLPGSDLAQFIRDLLGNDPLYLLDSRTFADPALMLLAQQRMRTEHMMQEWQAAQAAPEEARPEDGANQPLLTPLELRLLRGLSCGMSIHVAARLAGVEYWYAKLIISRLVRKLQARNRTGAVVRAWQLGLIALPENEMIFQYAGRSSLQAGSPDGRASGGARRQVVATNS